MSHREVILAKTVLLTKHMASSLIAIVEQVF